MTVMCNEHKSTYALLVRSEEKGRGIMETLVYALFGLSVIVSIWQFVQQPNRLPIEGSTSGAFRAPHMSDQVEVRLRGES